MADTLPPLQIADDLRCAPQAVELGLDPRGTATRCETLVLIEFRGRWPARIEDSDLVTSLPPLGPGHRILLTRGEDEAAGPALSVWRAGDDLRFAGIDYEVGDGRLVDAIAAMADGGEPNEADGVMTVGPAPAEVLICGHGGRDVCCGNFGVRLLAQIAERTAADEGGHWSGIRVRRCSHTGGHRFAPTGITLPEGRMWAFLDVELLDAIVADRPVPGLAASNRGLMALDPMAQVAEAALFDAVGPAWRSAERRVEPVGTVGSVGSDIVGSVGDTVDPGERASFLVGWALGDGTDGSTRVEVRRSGAVPVPRCGSPIDEATKSSPVYEVVSTG